MKAPEYPENELERLNTLRSLNILDTQPEERFDRLTRIARRLFGVPIALVSLVDMNRQWFKSRDGLAACETSREISFCGHAILQDDILQVPDTLLDDRFSDNPLVLGEPNIRFYAGVPLRVLNGSKLGTLCLIDKDPRVMSEEDKELLRDLGKMAEQELAALQLATMDDLTLLSNRRGFLALGSHTLSLCKRLNKAASLLFFDLDLFKEINDQYGHAEGDRALVAFSQLLKETFRESDVIARLGGDEFVVLLSHATAENLDYILERFQRSVEAHNKQSGHCYELACSVGVVEFDVGQHNSIDDLLKVADNLMYEQKQRKKSAMSN